MCESPDLRDTFSMSINSRENDERVGRWYIAAADSSGTIAEGGFACDIGDGLSRRQDRSGQPSMLLRPLSVSDEKQALQAHGELAREGFEFLFDLDQRASWPAYCERLESQRFDVDLPEGKVPATFLVAEATGQIVGRVSIRHALNAYLAEVGGHIGYAVRPGFRRRGYATALLHQSLVLASTIGLERVLVTCDDDNEGSAKVIESCGGVLENVAAGHSGLAAKRRYWVETGA